MAKMINLSGKTLAEQYYQAGIQQRPRLVKYRFSKQKKEVAARILQRIEREAVFCEFAACFDAWCQGIGISRLRGMCLIADNLSGCQTLMVRYGSGVALLHTEEDFFDIKRRLGEPHTFRFCTDSETYYTFTYCDLMPGAGVWSWGEDYVIAVDSLFLRESKASEVERPILANIVSWIVNLAMARGAELNEIKELIVQQGSSLDGYTLNIVKRDEGGVTGIAISFGYGYVEEEWLGQGIASHLARVNILPDTATTQLREYQLPEREIDDYGAFCLRIKRLAEIVEKHKEQIMSELTRETVPIVHQQLLKMVFDKYREDFVNEWMGAVAVALVDSEEGSSVSVKLREDISPLPSEYCWSC